MLDLGLRVYFYSYTSYKIDMFYAFQGQGLSNRNQHVSDCLIVTLSIKQDQALQVDVYTGKGLGVGAK